MSITPFRRGLNTLSGYVKAMGKWILLGLMMGLSGGLIGAAFSHFIRLVTGLRDSNSWLIWLLPFTGLLIVWLYRVFNANGLDTNTVFDGVTSGKPVPVRLLPAIFVSTVITHLFGGSAGKEGAALQLGGSVSSLLGRLYISSSRISGF